MQLERCYCMLKILTIAYMKPLISVYLLIYIVPRRESVAFVIQGGVEDCNVGYTFRSISLWASGKEKLSFEI